MKININSNKIENRCQIIQRIFMIQIKLFIENAITNYTSPTCVNSYRIGKFKYYFGESKTHRSL